MSAGFYLPDLSRERTRVGDVLALPDEESRHAKVLRLREREAVWAFNGRGLVLRGEVAGASSRDCRIRVVEVNEAAPPRPPRVVLAAAVCKGSRQEWMVEKITEMGVDEWIPLLTERSVVTPDERSGKLDRWKRIAAEACKQSGRAWLPEIPPPQSLADVLAGLSAADLLVAALSPNEAAGVEPADWTVLDIQGATPSRLIGLVGPEGGFTPDEVTTILAHHPLVVSLSDHILRVETAALALSIVLVGLRASHRRRVDSGIA